MRHLLELQAAEYNFQKYVQDNNNTKQIRYQKKKKILNKLKKQSANYMNRIQYLIS